MRKPLALTLDLLSKFKPSDGGYEEMQYIKASLLEEDKPSLSEEIKVINSKHVKFVTEPVFDLNTVEDIDKVFENLTLEKRRSYVEYNSRCYIQPIGYVAIYNESTDSFFMLRKIGGSNEARLHGKWGFVGGHWNSSFEKLSDSIIDEVSDEVSFDSVSKDSLPGFLLSNLIFGNMILFEDKPGFVESDHLGIVYILLTNDTNLKSKEIDKNEGKFIPRHELLNGDYELESWASKVVANFKPL